MSGSPRYRTDLCLSLGFKDTFRLHFQEEEDVVAIQDCTDSETQIIEAGEQLSGAHEWTARHAKRTI